MKIAIDCRMIGSGGIGSYITALLPFFTENHQCILFGNPENLEKFKNDKTEIVECSLKTFSLKELFAFPKFFSRKINECDIYYTPYCNIPSGIKIPVYSTIHDVVFLDVPGLASKTGCIIRKLFYQYAVLRSKLIFTVSEFSKQRIISNLHCKKNIVVTYNAVPDWFYSSQSQNIQIEKENSILFVGNIKKHKGLSVLVDAFIAAKKQGFSAQLKIVGNSENFRTADESIFQKIQTAPENSIVFTGPASLTAAHMHLLNFVHAGFPSGGLGTANDLAGQGGGRTVFVRTPQNSNQFHWTDPLLSIFFLYYTRLAE